jgi:hypothetical protein
MGFGGVEKQNIDLTRAVEVVDCHAPSGIEVVLSVIDKTSLFRKKQRAPG